MNTLSLKRGGDLTKSRNLEVDAKAAKTNESEIGIHEFLDQPDPTGGRGIKTAMGKELKELADKKREKEWILEEKKRIAKEKSKCQGTIG